MAIVSNKVQSSTGGRPAGYVWYFLLLGLASGGAVLAFAFLPQPFTAFVGWVALGIAGLNSLLGRRFPDSFFSARVRRGTGSVVYYVIFGTAFAGALLADLLVVRRGDLAWLGWMMAVVVAVVNTGGAMLVGARSTVKSASTL
jgi:hypothetical protein